MNTCRHRLLCVADNRNMDHQQVESILLQLIHWLLFKPNWIWLPPCRKWAIGPLG